MSAPVPNPAVNTMVMTIIEALQEEDRATLPPKIAGLLAGLEAVQRASAPAAASSPHIRNRTSVAPKVGSRKLHVKGPVQEDSEVSEEDWEGWASAVSEYITSVSERYPEGVPMPNVTNPNLYKRVKFVPYPGDKGGVEDALRENGFEIIENEETGGKLVKNRAA